MSENKKLGELLKEAGLVDDFQVEAALSHQRNWGGKLGGIIVELGFACEEDIARVISEKLKTLYVNLFEPEIAPDIIKLLKPEVVKKFAVVPVRTEGKALVLAMADPLDIATMDNIRFVTGMSIKPVLAMPSEIRDAIRKYYDGEAVDRKSRDLCREPVTESTRLEIVREAPNVAEAEWSQQHQQQQDAGALRRDLASQRIVIEALTALLIEKDLVTREELARFIEQKRMGM